MNEDVKNVWVTALETGKLSDGREVSQTTGWLCIQTDRERMCCLGVLTEEAVIAGVIDRANVDENGLVSYGLYEEIVILDFAVRDWAGIQSGNPVLVDETGNEKQASVWNDDEGKSFEDIAEMVKRSL